MKNYIILITFFLLIPSICFANVYCVNKSTGNDNNPGIAPGINCGDCLDESVSPWNTLKKTNTTSPGDKVCLARDNKWNEVLIPQSGVIYNSYGQGNLPIVDANKIADQSILINGKSNVKIQNIHVIDAKLNGIGKGFVINNSDNIELDKIKITNPLNHKADGVLIQDSPFTTVKNSNIEGGYHGIFVYSTKGFVFKLLNNDIHGQDDGFQPDWDGVKCGGNGNFSGSQILGNDISSFGEDGIDIKFCGGKMLIQNNNIYRPNHIYASFTKNTNINGVKMPNEFQAKGVVLDSNKIFEINSLGVGTCICGEKTDGHIISRNKCLYPAAYGMYVDGWKNVEVSRNTFLGGKFAVKVIDSYAIGVNLNFNNNVLAGKSDMLIQGANIIIQGNNNKFLKSGIVSYKSPLGGRYSGGSQDLFLSGFLQ